MGKHAGEVDSAVEGGGDANSSMEYIAWDKNLADADYLVKNKLISENAAPEKVWLNHPRFMKYSLQTKGKYQFHTHPPTNKPPPKVEVEVIKKGPQVEFHTSSLFGSAVVIKKEETKGKLLDILFIHLIVVCKF